MRAVLFDLDNTLVLEDLATARAFAEASAGASGRGVDPARLAAAVEAQAEILWRAGPDFAWADGIGISAGEALWGSFAGPGAQLASLAAFAPRYRQAVWSGALARCGVSETGLAAELDGAFERARRASEPVDPDAEAILEELGTRHLLAIVTNGAPEIQRAKLALTDLGRHFEAIVVSGEVGAGKPDPAPLLAALDALAVRSDEAVMVGDSLDRDVAAARAAGVYAVWLDRGSLDPAGSVASGGGAGVGAPGADRRGEASRVRAREGSARPSGPDARITSLRELPALLDALARQSASR